MRIQHFDKRGIERTLAYMREEYHNLSKGSSSENHAGYDELTPGYNDLVVAAAGLKVPASSAPSSVAWKTSLLGFRFANTGGEYLYIEGMQLPHSYVPGTDIYPHIHFVPESSIADGETVVWTVTYSSAPVWGVFPSTSTVTCTFTNNAAARADLDPAALSGTSIIADTHLIAGGATIDGENIGLSSIIMGRLERSSSDTFSGNVILLSADAHIQINRLGSKHEYKG